MKYCENKPRSEALLATTAGEYFDVSIKLYQLYCSLVAFLSLGSSATVGSERGHFFIPNSTCTADN